VIVCSEQAHSSVDKAARLLDMQIRKVPADAAFRMRADLCAEALAPGDVAAVVATVGTTSTTSVDPVEDIAKITHAAGAWLHVDAAYAGSSWVCPETRWSAAGVAAADSLVVNPHKWLFTPMDCSVLWTSRPDALRDAFSLVPEYLRTSDDADSLSDYGPALGRRFRALKLWAVIRAYGRTGLQVRIREAIRLAALFEGWVGEAHGWELCAPRPFSVVCFRMDGSDEQNAVLLDRVNATGEIFISHTKLDGRYVLRMAIGQERTREADVARAWQVIQREAAHVTTRMTG
jgi:aromatic-L-amino-acid decarboxylase